MAEGLMNVVADVNSGITVAELGTQVPQVAGVLVTLIIFGVGFVLMRRVLRGARKGKARI